MAFRKSTQQRRHQMLAAASLGSFHPRPASTAKTQTSSDNDYPKDTLSAIHYLMDLLQPQKVKQQKVFPRVCMVHQLYSIIKDNTAVDRTLAHLIKENKVRKFFLGGTGSDEFAIMFTSDYVTQIQQAKEQYLKDLEKSDHSSGGSLQGSLKRKAPHGSSPTTTRSPTINKKVIVASSPVGSPTATSIKACSSPSTTASGDQGHSEGEIFDRFRELIQSGQCLEISIQNSNIQSVIGATDQDITTLIRYSLLNRSLSPPANPHLVNLSQDSGRSSNTVSGSGGSSSSIGSTHSPLHQLIQTTNQDARSPSSPSTATTAPIIPSATTTIAASLGRRERVSDDIAYRFAIRQGGLFVTHFLKGRLEILRIIRRQTFKDMLASAVIAKPLRGSFLPHQFHIHDIVGSGRVWSDTTTSGQLLKLTQKGEACSKTK